MSAVITDPIIGYAIFATIKALGYWGFSWRLTAMYRKARTTSSVSEHVPKRISNPLLLGLARTAIGMTIGATYWLAVEDANPTIPLFILPFIRVIEWWLIIWLFCDRNFRHQWLGWRMVFEGVLVSFLLDIPAMLGFALVSLSIC